jgi:putative flavoprotein involved in K+ transport
MINRTSYDSAVTVETVVIGAGQAGLSCSHHLSARGREHLVLERGRVGETWRSQRWDGFYLNTPNWTLQLPGFEYEGGEPDAFAPLAEMIRYIEGYARSFDAPVKEGVVVNALRLGDGRYELDTSDGVIRARNVIVATGAFQRPRPPVPGVDEAAVMQISTSEYRNPGQLPEGGVLVVGSGQSGCQIADELIQAGRRVYLSVGHCGWFPRRYRGQDIMYWALRTGLLDEKVSELPSPMARLACNPPVSGNDGGHDCHPRWLAARGAVLVGRVAAVSAGDVSIEPGLNDNLGFADNFAAQIVTMIDDYLERTGVDAPAGEGERTVSRRMAETARLDLKKEGINSILWATGYRPDYSWIELPLVDQQGWPVQERGVTRYPGLYIVGLNWLYKRKSALLCGVGEDAAYVVDHLLARPGP